MTITAAATGTPIPKPVGALRFVDENGMLTNHGLQLLSQWREFLVGMNRVTPCNATGKNTITLAPLASGPLIEKYVDFEIFGFTAAETSDGDMSATVVPRTGTLATLNVYKDAGATRATAGDTVAGSFYWLVFVDSLDSGNGGFTLK